MRNFNRRCNRFALSRFLNSQVLNSDVFNSRSLNSGTWSIQEWRRDELFPAGQGLLELAVAVHEISSGLDAIDRPAEFVLHLANDRLHGRAVECAGWLVVQIDLRRAFRIVMNEPRRFVDRLADDFCDPRLGLDVGTPCAEDQE